ncbi:MAG TPA: thioredoxin [Acidimicrobiales bacterium]|nr:thioredoxin [Acidimicrobiales bacterium]
MADVTDATFDRDVIERSKQVAVIVDLWADWCGPCKTLGPVLERVVAETDGRVELAKIDIEANRGLAASFRVQSIPAVFAIRDGQVVDQFVGALPEAQVRQFVERVAPPPTEADLLAAKGDEASLREALELEPGHAGAVVRLAQLLVERGEADEALALLARVPETAEVRRVAALARVGAAGDGPPAGNEEIIEELEALLPSVKADGDARRRYLDLLEVLGADDPRSTQYRKLMTARLF